MSVVGSPGGSTIGVVVELEQELRWIDFCGTRSIRIMECRLEARERTFTRGIPGLVSIEVDDRIWRCVRKKGEAVNVGGDDLLASRISKLGRSGR